MAPSPAPSPTPPPPETDSIIDGLGASIPEENEGAVALPSFGNAEQNDVLGEPPEPPKEEKKPWDKPLTIPEIRKSSTNWSLASDSGLLLYLQEFSQRMIAKTSHLEKEVDGLVNTAKSTNTRVHNTFNDFLMLANTQFIENRVYDDSEDVEPPDKEDKNSKKEPQSKSREQREAEVIPRVIKALTLGVNVLDTAFEQLDANAGNSDSEDEDATYKSVDPILEPKDLYAHRALPYIIGTPAFMQDDDVGLADLYSDEEGGQSSSDDEGESETSESEYSDTDTESGDESAPKKGSRTTSTAKSGVSGDEYESDGDLFASDKAESDSEGSQSGTSKPKASPFADELAAKVAAPPPSTGAQSEETKARSVSEVSHTSSKHGKKDAKRKKKSKKQRSDSQLEKTDEDNLFGSPEGEDEDSPFGGKGLFSNTGGGLFDDEGAGLFDETPTKKKDHIYEDVNAGADQPKRKKAPSSSGLFDDEENDLFGSTPPASKQEPIKSSKPPAPSDSGLFGDDDDLFGEPETKAAIKAEKKQSVDLFGEDDDDLFGNESSAPKESKKKLPAGAVPMFGGANPLAGRSPPSISSDDDDFEEPPKMESQPKPQAKDTTKTPKTKPADDLFNNDDEDDLFSTPKEESNTKPKSRATAESLFDDIDGGGTEEDLFAATAKEPTKKKPVGGVALFGGADLFGGSPPKDKEEEKENESVKSRTGAKNRSTANTLSIFNDQPDGDGEDDLFADKPEEENDKSNMRSRSKSKSLFADEDVLFGLNEDDPSVDLFGSSSPTQSSKPDSPPSKGPKPAASASSGLFSDEDEDDLFGGSVLNKPKQVMVESTDISKPAETRKTKVAAGAGLFGDDDDDDLFGEGGPTPEKPPAKEPTKHKKHLAGAVSMFGGIDPASLIKEGPSPEQTGPSQHVVHGDIPPKSPLHDPSPPITSPKPPKKPETKKPAPVKTAQKPSSPPAAAAKISALQANLAIDPTALRPGAAPPRREEPILKVGFDVPVAVKPLTSLQKSRPRHTVKRRLPSRKVTASNQSGEDNIDGAIGGASLLSRSPPSSLASSRSPPPLGSTTPSFPPVHSQFSRSPPAWKPVKAPTLTKSSDLFGDDDDDLFGDPPELVKAAPQIEPDLPPEDPLGGEQARKDPLLEGEQAGVTSPPLPVDEDIFSDLSPKQEEVKDKESRPLADPSLKESDDLFGESKAVVPSLDVDTDLFAPVLPPQEKGILDDDDLFGELTGAKPKKKPAKVAEQDDDDLFAEQPKKPSKGKKVKPDSDLFADTTDIFAEIPASKPKGKKSKKKDADIFKSTVEDDIFSSSSSSTPSKTKKKAKKKTKPAADSIFDSSAPSIFDDPLNATKTD